MDFLYVFLHLSIKLILKMKSKMAERKIRRVYSLTVPLYYDEHDADQHNDVCHYAYYRRTASLYIFRPIIAFCHAMTHKHTPE